MTFADLDSPSSKDISPKKSPEFKIASITSLPSLLSLVIFTLPSTTKNKFSPSDSSKNIKFPLSKFFETILSEIYPSSVCSKSQNNETDFSRSIFFIL